MKEIENRMAIVNKAEFEKINKSNYIFSAIELKFSGLILIQYNKNISNYKV